MKTLRPRDGVGLATRLSPSLSPLCLFRLLERCKAEKQNLHLGYLLPMAALMGSPGSPVTQAPSKTEKQTPEIPHYPQNSERQPGDGEQMEKLGLPAPLRMRPHLAS